MLDTDGKTPLHLACESAYSLFMGDEGCERDPPSTDLISTMIKVCPPVVCWEDNDGKSALEYAILSGAPIEVVRFVTCLQSKKQEQEVQSIRRPGELVITLMIVNIIIVKQLRVDHQSKNPIQRLMALLPPRLQCQLGTEIFPHEGEEASFYEAARGMCREP